MRTGISGLSTHPEKTALLLCAALLLMIALGAACTKPIPSQFLLQQQNSLLSVTEGQDVNTRVDMLWVVDNSPSMEAVQTKVRLGVTAFAQQYLKPTWDIHIATITTDTYLADPTFWQGPSGQASYLTSIRGGTANYSMPYLNGASHNYGGSIVPPRSQHYYTASSWVTATAFPLFNSFEPTAYSPPSVTYATGGLEKFLAAGLSIADTKPQLGPNWAKLLIGNHDGPELSMCWDGDSISPEYIYGQTACYHRDDPANSQYHVGIANCANPDTANGETGPSQCVNTFANNSVHSGAPILSTIPPEGTPGDQAWIDQITAQFQTNLTPSTIGDASERPFQSVTRFLADNESSASTQFFRPNTLRIIVFVGDEDDQSETADTNQYSYGNTMSYGSGTPGSYRTGKGTYAHMVPENSSAPFICKKSYSGANNGYFFPTDDPGYCVDPAWLTPVTTIKQSIDSYFLHLDGSPATGNPNYFVATITTMNTAGLSQLGYAYIAQRYPELANLVGNGSLIMDITSSDYTPLLNEIGQSILVSKAQFTLQYPPTGQEQMIVEIVHADGTITVVQPSQYTVSGDILTITDLALVSSFQSTDQISINYQPATSY